MTHQAKKIRISREIISNPFIDLKNMVESRLTNLETKMDLLLSTCLTILKKSESLCNSTSTEGITKCCSEEILEKISALEQNICNQDLTKKTTPLPTEESKSIVLVPSQKPNSSPSDKVQLITLNSEDDLPEGSWLGDEHNPVTRVRVPIPPLVLLHLNNYCTTPEKMALTLLDCLFPREVLAVSNISGKGKHSKLQLDPLMIYGIRCHLVYKFDITEQDWYRIKQNIDSKCRTIWRRKMKGLPINGNKVADLLRFTSELVSEDSSDGNEPRTNDSQVTSTITSAPEQVCVLHTDEPVSMVSTEVLTGLLPSSSEIFSVTDNDADVLGTTLEAVHSEESNWMKRDDYFDPQ